MILHGLKRNAANLGFALLRGWIFLVLAGGVGSARAAGEQDAKFAALPKGVSVLAQGAVEKVRSQGEYGRIEAGAVEKKEFTKVIRVQTEKRPAQSYGFQLRLPTVVPVKKGAKLLVVFEARAVKSQVQAGVGETEFVFEMMGAPYTKSVAHPVHFGSAWQRFYIPFEAKVDHDAGQAAVIFRAGYDPQTIEIGGVQVIDLGAEISLSKLPVTPVTYVGREPDAAWRKVAAERIEVLRKADLKVTVTDGNGRPVPGVKVRAEMKRHSFGWGSAVDARVLLGQGADSERYREIVVGNFNKAVLENDMKWGAWTADPKRSMDAVAWLREHGLAVRGHVLLWPGKKNLPKHVVEMLGQPELVRKTVLEHIAEEGTAFRGLLAEWDVVNEPYTEFDVQTVLSGVARGGALDYVERHAATLVPFFRAAQAADPGAKLDINDYSIFETGGKDFAHQDHYERTIRALLAGGAPLQGIGIQGHFSEDLTPIPRLWQILDRFSKFGLPIQVTEFDVNTTDEILQADYTRDFLTAVFAHKGAIGVLVWGFWEKRHWIPNAAFYRSDWSLRPAGQVWLDLLQKRWHTDGEGVTDARGEWRIRGFQGEYEITAQAVQRSGVVKGVLPVGGAAIQIDLR